MYEERNNKEKEMKVIEGMKGHLYSLRDTRSMVVIHVKNLQN